MPAAIVRSRPSLISRKASGKINRKAIDRPAAADYGGKLTREEKGGVKELTSSSHRIRTLEQLLAHAEVDGKKWKVARYVVNKWEMGAKHPETGRILTEALFQVKVWLEPRAREAQMEGAMEELLADMKRHAPKYSKIVYSKINKSERHSLILSLPDLHLGKLAWGKETGSDYDINITKKLFDDAVKTLIARTQAFSFDEIVLPCGNDLLQSDNFKNMTTAGTPVDSDGRWQRVIVECRKMLVGTIDYLASIAPVRVIMVPGNHDMERTFATGEVLSAWYRKHKSVTIDNLPKPRKYWEYGSCFVMWTHGDKEKRDNLPLIAATENPEAWGRTTYREVHTGHLHSKRSTKFRDVDEFNGVRVRILPSLSAPDSWHGEHGYWNIRSAEALVFSPTEGCVATLSYNLPCK
jgi:hypothetical protein